ncbi:TPA: RNase A-like domain-containing protein [Klebsiella aerogenes]|jgi:hypothetical protein|uniref:RNase A-like domain-containing protein n=2 Tax=Klebsiella aerogenes TaxID=548 RepID=UPI0005DCD4F5|nr:RNase A-like domain-containing protein [Klebsiella aerogenes]EKU0355251.1 hypothetical protein [Klebsiella aerogenes]ELA3179395.1 hypothetical protein [Klebsiella aerogenes]ELN9407275.1 hypothetical protein [Klebsiella aerogenes]ELX9633734.1 hypothetical protein [Klebsiella aerogenes]EMC2746308.1 hypothetical protein [Klebsiella aerogenes]
MQENNGIRMALSPVQLAAVLADKSVSEGETLSNRLWGGLGLANGLVEMFGAGVMCIAPEPTMLTKIGCVIVGTHSLDTIQASFRQVWTGRQVSTDTYNSVVSLAESLGSDHQTAVNVGMTLDLAIPMGFALTMGAIRVASIRGGRIKLAEHESLRSRSSGGHTLQNHVGKTPEGLRMRLDTTPRLKSVSSFKSTSEAERLVSAVIQDNKTQIEMWVRHLPPGMNAKMQLDRIFANQTGILLFKGAKEVTTCYKVRVVIEFAHWHGKPYFVLTAFPLP